jgi:hypothetical protein
LLGFNPYTGVTPDNIKTIAALGAGLDLDIMVPAPAEDE